MDTGSMCLTNPSETVYPKLVLRLHVLALATTCALLGKDVERRPRAKTRSCGKSIAALELCVCKGDFAEREHLDDCREGCACKHVYP